LENIEPSIIISVSLLGALLTLIGTITTAYLSVKNAQVGASDEIATGSATLLGQYRLELDRLKLEIVDLRKQYAALQVKYDYDIKLLRDIHELAVDTLHKENIALRERVRGLEKKFGTGPFKQPRKETE
jgi:hypothetical protein